MTCPSQGGEQIGKHTLNGQHEDRRPDIGDTVLTLLGTWRLDSNSSRQYVPLGAQRLLAFLAVSGRSSREHVAGTLWPEVDEVRARGNLRSALWRLNQSHPRLLDFDSNSLALSSRIKVDVEELRQTAHGLRSGAADVGRSLPPYLLVRELLPGWYDDWVLLERERLRQLRLHALEAAVRMLCREGRHGLALEAALAAVRADPLREGGHRMVMEIHLAEGNVAEAIEQYESCRMLLRNELGVEPSRLLVDIRRRIGASAARSR